MRDQHLSKRQKTNLAQLLDVHGQSKRKLPSKLLQIIMENITIIGDYFNYLLKKIEK